MLERLQLEVEKSPLQCPKDPRWENPRKENQIVRITSAYPFRRIALSPSLAYHIMAIPLLIFKYEEAQGNSMAAIIRRANPLPVIENSSLIINENDDRRPAAGGRKSLESRNHYCEPAASPAVALTQERMRRKRRSIFSSTTCSSASWPMPSTAPLTKPKVMSWRAADSGMPRARR